MLCVKKTSRLLQCYSLNLKYLKPSSVYPVFTSKVSNQQRFYCESLIGVNDYDEERKTFKLHVPEYYNFSKDVIDKWTSKHGTDECNDTGLFWINDYGREVKWSFVELSRYSKRVANILEDACKLEKGDTIIVLLGRNPEWWLFTLGSIRSGIVMSPGTMLLKSQDIKYRLNSCKAKCLVTDELMAPEVDMIANDCPHLKTKLLLSENTRPGWLDFKELFDKASEEHVFRKTKSSDPMSLYFTSGTTGAPKMTEHTHASYGIGHWLSSRYCYDAHPTDAIWGLSDSGWAKAAYASVFGPWLAGSCSFVHSAAGKFDPKRCLEILSNYPVSVFCAPPTCYRLMINENLAKYKFNALRHCIGGGEPLNPEIFDTWLKETGHKIYEGYGQTETTGVITTLRCMEPRPGSMGKPVPGVDVAIIDEEGKELPPNKEGYISVKVKPNHPVGLFSRYVNDEEKTAACFRGDYYMLGDRGMLDEDGYIWFIGRSDDVIISAGYRIGPFEVESALLEHDAVLESAVVSSPDPVRGAVVKAFVILTPEYSNYKDKEALKEELKEHVRKVTAPYKYPRKVEFVKELPKTVSNKIRRVELREKEWEKNKQ